VKGGALERPGLDRDPGVGDKKFGRKPPWTLLRVRFQVSTLSDTVRARSRATGFEIEVSFVVSVLAVAERCHRRE
jgi:hypothetical protein